MAIAIAVYFYFPYIYTNWLSFYFLIGDLDPRKVNRVTAQDARTGQEEEIVYTNCRVIGNGSFGVVFQAELVPSGEQVAIKKVLQDKRFKVSLFGYLYANSAHQNPPF